MLRTLARIIAVLVLGAALAAPGTGAALAAPPGYTVNVHHSSGTLAMTTDGNLFWSTSLRTVTMTGMSLYVRSGEVATVTWQAYQGSTLVDSLILSDQTQSGPIANSSLTSGPGGITRVLIRLYDVNHVINEYANCYQSASVCQYS